MEARAVEKKLERGEQSSGGGEQNEQDADQADGEPLADLDGVRERHGDGGEPGEDEEGGGDLRGVAGDFLGGGVDEGVVGVLDGTAQDEDGSDAADVQQ